MFMTLTVPIGTPLMCIPTGSLSTIQLRITSLYFLRSHAVCNALGRRRVSFTPIQPDTGVLVLRPERHLEVA